jgi:hypothetical protein
MRVVREEIAHCDEQPRCDHSAIRRDVADRPQRAVDEDGDGDRDHSPNNFRSLGLTVPEVLRKLRQSLPQST